MRNLHLIGPSFRPEELSVLYYDNIRNTPNTYRFRVSSQGLEYYQEWRNRWTLVLIGWNTELTMEIWLKAGKPMPDLSKVEH